MNIITGKLMPDEGTIEWAKNVKTGYLDQHAVLQPGMTIRDVLAGAFEPLFAMEARMNELYEKMADCTEEELNIYMEETGTIQDLLTNHDFYMIDAKVEEVARALGLSDLGLDRDVTELSGGQRTKILLGKLLLEKPEFHFKTAKTPSRVLFETKDLVIGYDEPLSSPLNVTMERGSCIVLTGANGIGKSTLLKSILMVCHEPEFYRELATQVWDCTKWTTKV